MGHAIVGSRSVEPGLFADAWRPAGGPGFCGCSLSSRRIASALGVPASACGWPGGAAARATSPPQPPRHLARENTMPALEMVGQHMPAAKRRKVLGDRTNANTVSAAAKKALKKTMKKTKQKKAAKKTAKVGAQTTPTAAPPGPAAAAPLPAGWVVDVSRESGESYYRNTVTDDAQWEVPDVPAVDTSEAVEHVRTTLDELGAAGIHVIECVPPQP